MPSTGVRYRAYFFSFSFVIWFDHGPEGRTWSGVHGLEDVWPDLRTMMVPDAGDEPLVERAAPITPSVLRLSRSSRGSPVVAYVDVRRRVQVPPPLPDALRSGTRQVVSWDPGPIALVIDPPGSSTHLVDVTTGTSGPPSAFDWGNPDFPIIALPGEPIHRFWPAVPVQVEHRNAEGNQVMQSIADVFPPLAGVGAIDAATVMYGDFRRPTVSDVTAALDDGDLQALRRAAGRVGRDGPELFAVLHLLSGGRPTAFHPDGRYGLGQLSPEQLLAGGWTESPERIVRAGAIAQLDVLGNYLASFPAAATESAERVFALLATAQPIEAGDDTTVVVPAPVPARLAALAPPVPDGEPAPAITLGDLRRLVDGVLESPLGDEIFGRLRGFSFV